MNGTGVIDNFLGVSTQYIDSGFGLVQGDVLWLAVLIVIDVTLAGLCWDQQDHPIPTAAARRTPHLFDRARTGLRAIL